MSFAVAAGHRLTAESAVHALEAGGTAVDACLAAACAAFVAEPVLAQPLGGGFLMLAPPSGPPRLLDAFVQTPGRRVAEADLDLATVTVDFGTATQDFHIGAGTMAVPCLVPALFEAHDRAGRLPWREIVAPARALAREGVTPTAFQRDLEALVGPILAADPGVAALFPAEGARTNPALADVLEVMALEGPRFFSHGEMAAALAAMPGGAIARDDIAHAAPRWRTPLTHRRQGTEMALNPPPSLGGVQAALALALLDPAPGPVAIARALAEVARQRRALAIDDAPEDAADRALDPALIVALRRALAAPPAPRGTTHISVVGPDGLGAALSLSNGEGCGRVLPGTGILPNNMLGEEDLVPGGPHGWRPGTRLASMMCPAAARAPDGTLTLLGSGGSSRIRSAIATTALALIDDGLAPEEAVRAPRMHVEDSALHFETGDDAARREALLAAFPDAREWSAPHMFFGGVHIARRGPRGASSAAADPRRDGWAVTG